MKQKNIPMDYPLAWFNDLISGRSILHMNGSSSLSVLTEKCEEVMERADDEFLKIKTQLNQQIFQCSSRLEMEILVRQYHSSLIQLQDDAFLQNQSTFTSPVLKSTHEHVLSKIGELILYIENRFLTYLNEQDQAPQSYLAHVQAEFLDRLPLLIEKLKEQAIEPKLVALLTGRIHRFCSARKQNFRVSYKTILYKKELIKNLMELKPGGPQDIDYSALDKLLIYLNYNSKSYIQLLMAKIKKRINQADTAEEKIDQLSLSFKVFNQVFRKSDVALNPMFEELHHIMSGWFTQEITYLERKLDLRLTPVPAQPSEPFPNYGLPRSNDKLLCILSIDQIALAIRALDDLQIVKAKSKSHVFATLVPFLSTRHKENLSPGSMRSKAYSPEEKDRQIMVQTLEKMIARIMEY